MDNFVVCAVIHIFFLVSWAYHTIPERAESKIPVQEAPSLSPHMGETEGGQRPIYKNIWSWLVTHLSVAVESPWIAVIPSTKNKKSKPQMICFTSVRKRSSQPRQSKHKEHPKSLSPKAAKIGWVHWRGGWHLFFFVFVFFCSWYKWCATVCKKVTIRGRAAIYARY